MESQVVGRHCGLLGREVLAAEDGAVRRYDVIMVVGGTDKVRKKHGQVRRVWVLTACLFEPLLDSFDLR